MKLKRYQFNSLLFVSIVDDMDCPVDPYVCCYLNGPLSGKAPNTRIRYANELLFLLQYFSEKNINLPARAASGSFISQREYMQFYDRCVLNKSGVDEDVVLKFTNVNDKHLRNIISANQRGMAKVSHETLQGRIRQLRKYLVWLCGYFHEAQGLDEVRREAFIKLVSKVRLDEQGLGRNRPQEVRDPDESVIPSDVFVELLEMVIPSSLNNPFKASRLRNYLIVYLLAQSGIRRGALAKLKISDFKFYGTYDQMLIYRSGNDPTDLRVEKPNQKTKSHLATVSHDLMVKVKFYIDHIRSAFPRAQFHDYLLISESNSKGTAGQPLSLKSINAIFHKLSKALGFHVHPHQLRHKWNEVLDEVAEVQGVDPALLEDVRKYAMGWAQDSTMSRIYNEKRLALKARELSKAHQERVDRQK